MELELDLSENFHCDGDCHFVARMSDWHKVADKETGTSDRGDPCPLLVAPCARVRVKRQGGPSASCSVPP